MAEYITEFANDIANCCTDLVESGCGNDNCIACLAFKLIGLGYTKQIPTSDVVPKSDWISVDERLPEPLENVLVCDMDGNIDIDFLLYSSRTFVKKGVTHWMPLPKPPKMKGE